MQLRAFHVWRLSAAAAVAGVTAFASPALASEGGVFPPFDPSHFPSHLFWLAVCFGALYWLMSKVALPRVSETLAARSETIARDLDQANAMHAKVEAVAKEHEQALAESRGNAQAIAQEARTASARESDAKRHATEADLARKLAEAEKTIAARKTVAMAHVEGIAAGAATEIVGKLTGQVPTEAEATAAVRAAIRA